MALSNHIKKNARNQEAQKAATATQNPLKNAASSQKKSSLAASRRRNQQAETPKGEAYIDTSEKTPILRISRKKGEDSEQVTASKLAIREDIMKELVDIDEEVDEDLIKDRIEEKVADKLQGMIDRERQLTMVDEIFNSIMRLGELQPLMETDGIGDICVNSGGREIFADRGGIMYLTDLTIDSEECRRIVDRIAGRAGKHVDEAHPALDCTLYDGSRVNITVFPMAVDGTSISIRRFPSNPLGIQDLLRSKMLNANMAKFIKLSVEGKCNIIISGGTSSGKTTFLNILSNFIPPHERIITIEDACELQIKKPNLVRLESRDANAEGKGRVSIRDCVVDTLRMRPDRIIVGECRSDEVVDMLQAMNTGHDGSLTTIHSNSARDCLGRLETMFLMAGVDMPVAAIRKQICSAIDLIIQIERDKTGHRHVVEMCEVLGMEGDVVSTNPIFQYNPETKRHEFSGAPPRTISEKCLKAGIVLPDNLWS